MQYVKKSPKGTRSQLGTVMKSLKHNNKIEAVVALQIIKNGKA